MTLREQLARAKRILLRPARRAYVKLIGGSPAARWGVSLMWLGRAIENARANQRRHDVWLVRSNTDRAALAKYSWRRAQGRKNPLALLPHRPLATISGGPPLTLKAGARVIYAREPYSHADWWPRLGDRGTITASSENANEHMVVFDRFANGVTLPAEGNTPAFTSRVHSVKCYSADLRRVLA